MRNFQYPADLQKMHKKKQEMYRNIYFILISKKERCSSGEEKDEKTRQETELLGVQEVWKRGRGRESQGTRHMPCDNI
jgi:hypothetical protein